MEHKINIKKIISFILVIIFLILGFFLLKWQSNRIPPMVFPKLGGEELFVKIAGQNIKVEIVRTPAEQAQGLSGRDPLKEGEGMLFVFEKLAIYPFWMKDMKFSIDIIWISAEKKVVYIKKNAHPEDYPQSYEPKTEQGLPLLSKYVLEVASGFSDKYNLKVGDEVKFN